MDIGGTFTDIVLEYSGRRRTKKVLTTPEAPEDGVIDGLTLVLDEASINPSELSIFLHGTTLATNAIIERKGAKTAFITTRGFRDVLEIGYESRYNQYDLLIEKPVPLIPRSQRYTVTERVDVKGNVLNVLNEKELHSVVAKIIKSNIQSVAVGFLHAYANPAHEQMTKEILLEKAPNLKVSISAEVCPEIREFERFTTTSANAYVQPLMSNYLGNLQKRIIQIGVNCPILLMTSGGGLMSVETAQRFPIRLVESGPAGGAILATQIAAELGLNKVISYDMGGTTAKICLIEEQSASKAREFEVDRQARFMKGSGLPLRIPVIEMVEIGAGGGSIARVNSMNQITTGPDSAGANPGPAAYNRGGTQPTISDADVHLGRIDPKFFAGGHVKLDPALSASTIENNIAKPLKISSHMAAFGIAEIVDETMSNAARVHAVERGYDARDHVIIAFGGAAPLHVGRIAEKLNISKIVIPTNAGVGSAVGLLRAPVAYEVVRSHNIFLRDFDFKVINSLMNEMKLEALEVVKAGAPLEKLKEEKIAFMRYAGQGHEIIVSLPDRKFIPNDKNLLNELFNKEYQKLYGRVLPNADVEVLTWAITLGTFEKKPAPIGNQIKQISAPEMGFRAVFDTSSEKQIKIPVYSRADLKPGAFVDGPALIVEEETSSFIPETFEASIAPNNYIILDRKLEAK